MEEIVGAFITPVCPLYIYLLKYYFIHNSLLRLLQASSILYGSRRICGGDPEIESPPVSSISSKVSSKNSAAEEVEETFSVLWYKNERSSTNSWSAEDALEETFGTFGGDSKWVASTFYSMCSLITDSCAFMLLHVLIM